MLLIEIERVRCGDVSFVTARSMIRFAEGCRDAGRQNHIGAAPGLVVHEPPAMPGAGGILGQQNVAGTDDEGLVLGGLELKRTG